MSKNVETTGRIIQTVIDRKLSHREAAVLLDTSIRTIHNYIKRYLEHGRDGLVDHRRSNNHKLSADMERRIVECKAQRPERSAQWIRDWLKLGVSLEAVRRVLIKNHFTNGRIDGLKTSGARKAKRINHNERQRHGDKRYEPGILTGLTREK
jgi:transposase